MVRLPTGAVDRVLVGAVDLALVGAVGRVLAGVVFGVLDTLMRSPNIVMSRIKDASSNLSSGTVVVVLLCGSLSFTDRPVTPTTSATVDVPFL
tara:strand:- start:6897 stop:7175 length:279 start_codon:yes stop_codon:yes gene_type:complete